MASVVQQLTLIASLKDVLVQQRVLLAGYQVRQTAPQDQEALAALYLAVYPPNIVADIRAAREEMEHTFAGEYGHLTLAVSPVLISRGTLIAAVMIVAAAPWSDTPAGPFIIEVMVHPHHQRMGLAHYALQWAASGLMARGEHTIALRVMSDNVSACALYHKLGFRLWTGPIPSCQSGIAQ